MTTKILSRLMILLGFLLFPASTRPMQQQEADSWTMDFHVDRQELSTIGQNPHFILEPGYYLVLEKGAEQVTISVLNSTKKVGDFETRVVEERETEDGNLVEISRNYYAISTRTNSVFYFGEDVDDYKNGKVSGHGGSWMAGVNGAKFGLMMPGILLMKSRYYQEVAPRVAMDRAEIVSLKETVRTEAGEFRYCLKTEETTPLEPGVTEYKYYAPGVGLVQDGSLKLVKYGRLERPAR